MPRFTITTDEDNGADWADESIDFPDVKAATDDAQMALADMARERLPNGKRAEFGVTVADEAGKEVYRASLEFRARTEDEIDRDGGLEPRDAPAPRPPRTDEDV